jgi:hypothetical protein
MSSSTDYTIEVFREWAERRWSLHSKLDQLYEAVAEIDNIIKGYTETRKNRLISGISIYGFPLALFAGFFQFIFQDIPSDKWLGVHWTGLIIFTVLTLLSIKLIQKLLKHVSSDSPITRI